MREIETAKKMFDDGHACSQAMLAAFAERYGLTRDLALKLATGFGGGMGRQGMTCGAVTGALMVLGLDAGRVDLADAEARERTDALVQEFLRRFREKHNYLNCNELTGVQMQDPAAREAAKEAGTFENVCPGVVGYAAQLVTELLEYEPD